VFVLDTSVLIDLLRGSPQATAWLAGLDDVPVCSEVTRTEVMQGMRSQERRATERLFQALRWIPVDERVSRRAGELGRQLRGSHPGLSLPDLLIGASALELGAELATSNVRHFPMFEDLEAPYADQSED